MNTLIVAELWVFVEHIYKNGVSDIESTPQFKAMSNVISYHGNVRVAIPYWVLIDGEDDPRMTHEYLIQCKPICDDEMGCYIFKDFYSAIYGCLDISRELSIVKPNPYYQNQFDVFRYALKIMEEQGDMNNLCGAFRTTGF